jgi:hypothetical protein
MADSRFIALPRAKPTIACGRNTVKVQPEAACRARMKSSCAQ